jgi:hypothetical protein
MALIDIKATGFDETLHCPEWTVTYSCNQCGRVSESHFTSCYTADVLKRAIPDWNYERCWQCRKIAEAHGGPVQLSFI